MTKTHKFDVFLKSQADNSGCWIYHTSVDKDGYKRLKYKGEETKTHRKAYEIFYGVSVKGIYVLHKCDNMPCCNPEHLFIGTQKDNIRDAMKKMRHTHGEMMGGSKLNEAAIIAIRKSNNTQVVIAKEYGICQSQVSNIIRRKQWSHVN